MLLKCLLAKYYQDYEIVLDNVYVGAGLSTTTKYFDGGSKMFIGIAAFLHLAPLIENQKLCYLENNKFFWGYPIVWNYNAYLYQFI